LLRICYAVHRNNGDKPMKSKSDRIVKQTTTPDKPRKTERGLRERTWTGPDGTIRSSWQADLGKVNGKRIMKSFKTKAKAELWLQQKRLIIVDQGVASLTLTDIDRLDAVRARSELATPPRPPKNALADFAPKTTPVKAIADILSAPAPLETISKIFRECCELLDGTGGRLQDAARFYVQHHRPTEQNHKLSQVIAEYIDDAKANNLRPRSVADIATRTGKFLEAYPKKTIAEITRADADRWISSRPDLSAVSRRHNRTVLFGLFQYSIDRGYYTADNPFASKRHRRTLHEDEVMPTCMKWSDVDKILQAALKNEPSMVPGLAIGFFAGLRTAEVCGMRWENIDLGARRITVMPAVAKKRRARHVTIEDNLLKWLTTYRRTSGLIAPTGRAIDTALDAAQSVDLTRNATWRARLDRVRKLAGVTWPNNAMRHSFASHHLVKYGDPQRTAFQLGHGRDVSMLFEHYRSLVTKEDADHYFTIVPEATGKVISLKTA
jgi:integrase